MISRQVRITLQLKKTFYFYLTISALVGAKFQPISQAFAEEDDKLPGAQSSVQDSSNETQKQGDYLKVNLSLTGLVITGFDPAQVQSAPLELMIYDSNRSESQRVTLKLVSNAEKPSWQGSTLLPVGGNGFKSAKIRQVTFMKNKGWHFLFTSKFENGVLQVVLSPKRVTPEEGDTLDLVKLPTGVTQKFAQKKGVFQAASKVGLHPISHGKTKFSSGGEAPLVPNLAPVKLRLIDPNQKTPPEVLVYDEMSKSWGYLHLEEKEKGSGVFEGLYMFRIGPSGVYLPRFRTTSYLKNKGWHYPYRYEIEKDDILIELNPRLTSPVPFKGIPTQLIQNKVKETIEDKKQFSREEIEALIKEEKYAEAEAMALLAIKSDPFDYSFRYYLGVALYHQKRFEEAAKEFDACSDEPGLGDEANYYAGISFYEVKNLADAKSHFEKVLKGKTDRLFPSTHYYLGLIKQSEKQWDPARDHYKKAEQLSNDPEFKKVIYVQVKRVDQDQAYYARLSKRFSGFASIDFFQYDSNVVMLPDSLVNVSNKSGFGFSGNLGLTALAFLLEKHEMSVSYQLSWNYHPNSDFIKYDSWSHTFSTPYSTFTSWDKKPVRLSFSPGVTVVTTDEDERKVPPMTSPMRTYFLNSRQDYYLSDSGSLETHLNYGYDNNFAASTEDDDATGHRIGVGGTYNWFLGEKKEKGIGLGGNIEWVNTIGRNYKQFKPSVTANYHQPLIFEFDVRPEVSFFHNNYYLNTSNRKDSQAKLSLSFTRPVTESIYFTQSDSYTRNFSNVLSGDYSRFIIDFSFGTSF